MGQENSTGFNCGLFEKDNRTEVRGDQAMKIRKMLEQERVRYETPSHDNEPFGPVVLPNPKKRAPIRPQPQTQLKNLLSIEHGSILKLSKEPFEKCVRTEHGFYEQSGLSLANLIESRYNTEMLFPEEQVIKLLENVIYAIAFLEKKRFRHHDIYPTNIYYVDGTFKLAHPKFVQSSYELTRQRKRFSFLSPQLIIALRDEIDQVEDEQLYKSDVFSLGMIMLEFCSLKPSCEIYDSDNYDIIDSCNYMSKTVIQERLQSISQKYSHKIVEVIRVMLEYEVSLRIDGIHLAQLVNQQVTQLSLQQETIKRAQLIQQNQQSALVVQQHPPQQIIRQPQTPQQQYNPQQATPQHIMTPPYSAPQPAHSQPASSQQSTHSIIQQGVHQQQLTVPQGIPQLAPYQQSSTPPQHQIQSSPATQLNFNQTQPDIQGQPSHFRVQAFPPEKSPLMEHPQFKVNADRISNNRPQSPSYAQPGPSTFQGFSQSPVQQPPQSMPQYQPSPPQYQSKPYSVDTTLINHGITQIKPPALMSVENSLLPPRSSESNKLIKPSTQPFNLDAYLNFRRQVEPPALSTKYSETIGKHQYTSNRGLLSGQFSDISKPVYNEPLHEYSSKPDTLADDYRKTNQLLARLNLDNKPDSTASSGRNSSYVSSAFGKKYDDESLDERVRRILEKSKQIK